MELSGPARRTDLPPQRPGARRVRGSVWFGPVPMSFIIRPNCPLIDPRSQFANLYSGEASSFSGRHGANIPIRETRDEMNEPTFRALPGDDHGARGSSFPN